MNEDKELKVSFQSKEEYNCPVCMTTFHREELLSGSGRLIAGIMTDELHRLYEPSVKYGEIHPLVYQATVCPECWFASIEKDFLSFPASGKNTALADEKKRIADTKNLFPGLDFRRSRNLINGAASQYLVLRCYDYFPKDFSPTIKQGIAALRAGWLMDHLAEKYPDQHFDWLALTFKKKAQFLYGEAVLREQAGKETLSACKNFGPDTDKNYSYEGALYLSGLLKLKYGPKNDMEMRKASLDEIKRIIAKIFGLGKTSKSRPGPLLEKARNLYSNINQELHEADD
ncbi:MAG: DUF2225 domain-containing protein [Treponema sp.]|jgi:uncharacterized protein (DUF2225 family)|nr:DUF2225 domain-containing protein [Treponema sp.]